MKWTMSILAALVMATWTGVAAQAGSSTNQGRKMDSMAKMDEMDARYTGCIQSDGAGRFTLTHAVAATDGMAANSMNEASTKKDGMAKDMMMKKDAMMSTTLTLSSTAVDLSRYVGRRMSVTGEPEEKMGAMDEGAGAMAKEPASFVVKSLKAASGACS